MPLADDQRAWLDQALRSKGRFTRAASIRKEFENYQRRREKAAAAWAGLTADHPDYQTIQNGLQAADDAASQGKFADAYKSLSRIKDLAKAAVEGRADGLHDANVRMTLKVLEGQVNVTTEQVDGCFRRDAALQRRIAALPQASEADDFEAGLAVLRQINDLAGPLRADVAQMITDYRTAAAEVRARDVGGTITRLEADLAALRVTGRGDIADKYSGGLDTLARIYRGSGGRYTDTRALGTRAGAMQLELEQALATARALGANAPDPQAASVREDDQTDAIRAGLTPLPDEVRRQMELAEQERADARVQEYFRQRNTDSFTLLDTSTEDLTLAPMPEKYNFDTVFAGLFPRNDTIPDEVPDDLRDQLTTNAVQRITDGMTDDDASEDVLLNMSVRSASEFVEMAVEQLFPGQDLQQLTRSQKGLVTHMAEAMEREVCARAPNKMSDDASEITVGGVRYELVKVLKSGGNGTARLYRDPNPPNETIVVKTMIQEDRRADMAYEIETHYRATKATGGDEDSSIVEFKGAARSDDGGVHLVMEAVSGGDLEDMNAGLGAMESLGLLPPEAKHAIAVENMRKVLEAMKELEAQGLVNHDLKPENVMFTSDGRIKIIDYGEADFVEDDGVARPERKLSSTMVYQPAEGEEKTFTTKFDIGSLGAVLQKLVAGAAPEAFDIDMKPTSAVGRLIARMRDPDPEKRPSLDAILASTIMASAEEDHGPEAMENLTAASSEFAGLITGLSLDMDQQTLFEGVGRENITFFGGNPPKLSKAQAMMSYIDSDISRELQRHREDKDYAMTEGRAKLEELMGQKKFVQNQLIDKMIGDQLEKGETEYAEAMESTEKSVGFSLGDGYREVTPKDAHTLVERLRTSIETLRGQAFRLIEDDTLSERQITEQLDPINQKLADQAIYVERIEAALKDALGPAAKLFLAKKRLNEAVVNFRGGKRAAQEVDDGGPIPVDPTDALSRKERLDQGMETIANKRKLAGEIDEKATT